MVLKHFDKVFDCLKSSIEERGLPPIADDNADKKDFPISLCHTIVLIHAVPHIGNDNERVGSDGKRDNRKVISKKENARNQALDPAASQLLFESLGSFDSQPVGL